MSSTAAVLVAVATGCASPEPEFEPWVLDELTGARGFSVRIPDFEVEAGHERQDCYFVRVPDINSGEDVWVERVQMAINPGSHHMSVFRVRTIFDLDPELGEPIPLGALEGKVVYGGDFEAGDPCWDTGNWNDWPLVANSQVSDEDQPYLDWQLPPNVAIRLRPGELLMLQPHYVNSTDQPTKYGGKIGVNFYAHEPTAATQELGTLFATQQSIRVCQSRPEVTFSGTCRIPSDQSVTIVAANGHFHSRGRQFRMFAWDGQSQEHPAAEGQFYESNSWNDPPMARDLSVAVPGGGGIWWDCDYQWTPPEVFGCDAVNDKDVLGGTDCCYTFGGNTDVGEHCNAFVYYYPKLESDVFCN